MKVMALYSHPDEDQRQANLESLREDVTGKNCLAVEGFSQAAQLVDAMGLDLKAFYPRRIEIYDDGSFNLVLQSRYSDTQLLVKHIQGGAENST